MLVGRLTKNADLAYTQGGMCIVNFSVAVNRSQKSEEGYIDRVSFFEVKVFGKMGENLNQYLKKGQQVAIVGALTQDRWEDNNGNKHSKISIICEDLQLLGGKKDNQDNNGGGYSAPAGNNFDNAQNSFDNAQAVDDYDIYAEKSKGLKKKWIATRAQWQVFNNQKNSLSSNGGYLLSNDVRTKLSERFNLCSSNVIFDKLLQDVVTACDDAIKALSK
jgi:single-strand DNA-binding protein